MKISVSVEVSYNTAHHVFDLDDLNISEQEWDLLTDAERKEKIQEACYDLPESPSWMVSSYEIK